MNSLLGVAEETPTQSGEVGLWPVGLLMLMSRPDLPVGTSPPPSSFTRLETEMDPHPAS